MCSVDESVLLAQFNKMDLALGEIAATQHQMNVHLATLNGETAHAAARVLIMEGMLREHDKLLTKHESKLSAEEVRSEMAEKERFWTKEKMWQLILLVAMLLSTGSAIAGFFTR